MDEYTGRLILKNYESIRRFYDHCLHRNYELKVKLNLPERLILQDKLDDNLIRAAFKNKTFITIAGGNGRQPGQ